jgi:hypothetical protein
MNVNDWTDCAPHAFFAAPAGRAGDGSVAWPYDRAIRGQASGGFLAEWLAVIVLAADDV